MKLTALRLHNVRRFANRGIAIEGIGDGVNVFCAGNEHGKSTCFDALHALFFQPHTGTPGAVQSLRPYSGGSPLVEADIVTAGRRYRLSKQFYGGRRATVVDLATGRLVGQADEAEAFIDALVCGNGTRPAGLLWVRQGNTGVEKRSKSEEESEKRAREGVLSSVQGEVEALTGGRRMVEAVAACEEELSRLVTATGRAKTGGLYAAAIDERKTLAEAEQRLEQDVESLRQALDARRKAKKRLAELQNPDEADARRRKLEQAEAALQAARSHHDALKAAEAEAELCRSRRDDIARELGNHRTLLARARDLAEQLAPATVQRDRAVERRRQARAQAAAAAAAVDKAEQEEREAQELLARLDRAMRAKEAAERTAALQDNLRKAEAARQEVEQAKAALRTLRVPPEALDRLEAVETDLAGLRAAVAARSPSVTVQYAEGAEGSVCLEGEALAEGKDYPIGDPANLRIGGIGTLTIATKIRQSGSEELAEAEERHRALLAQIGVASLAEARQRDAAARQSKAALELAQQRLKLFAPEGLEALRDALARSQAECVSDDLDISGDPQEARAAHEAARDRVTESRNRSRECSPLIERADEAAVEAETQLAAICSELERINATLGPEPDRVARDNALAEQYADAERALSRIVERVEALKAAAIDIVSAEAAVKRARSVAEAAENEINKLGMEIADLNGRIAARSEDAVEEAWRETADAHRAAAARVARLEREIAVLQRLRTALHDARAEARDHYFEPVLRELRPLMGLLFDDAEVVFDDQTLLPRRVHRNGQEEDVERLSGGMREQLAVLTRLAFARLLACDGTPTPVILDDALVYSDDDRIEKMFDALHRQGRDQQVIVFSCRQRAFSSLGGNTLQMVEWFPDH